MQITFINLYVKVKRLAESSVSEQRRNQITIKKSLEAELINNPAPIISLSLKLIHDATA